MTSIVSTDLSIIILALTYWYLWDFSLGRSWSLLVCGSGTHGGPPKIQEPIGKIQGLTNIENKRNEIEHKK